MGKIDELEQKMIQQGITDADFIEYEKLLKRVRGFFAKRQHCYTTAIQFPHQYAAQAVKLIEFGLENFEDGWFSTYTSYLYIGRIYEKTGNYAKAFESYVLAEKALGPDHPSYVQELAKDLLWMKLHIDAFCYSAELENYYKHYLAADAFSQSFVNNEFRIAVAAVVILLHHGQTNEARQMLEAARKICRPNYTGKLFHILARHKYQESLDATPEAIAFIENAQI